MKTSFQFGYVLLLMLAILSSCKKEAALDANLDLIDQNEITNKTATDLWLDQNFLDPYNIETKYRFDRNDFDYGKYITPAQENQVIPVMETVRNVWIRPFEIAGGADFIKRHSPKQFVLVGNAEYNSDGSITLGTAEGGRKIVLYVVNEFYKGDLSSVKKLIQVIQHEYTHILNQTVDFQPEYQEVSRGGYDGNWTQRPLSEAYSLGFITQYARVSPLEDFAEQSSNMLVMGRVKYNLIVASAPLDAQVKFKKKEQLVVEYYKTAFNIDFYQLQNEVQKELYKISPPQLYQMIGVGVGYTTLYTKPATDPKQSPEFLQLWKDAVTAELKGNGFALEDMTIMFKSRTLMTIRYHITIRNLVYDPEIDFDISLNVNNGLTTFKERAIQTADNNHNFMAYFKSDFVGIHAYLQNNQFKAGWFNQIIPGEIATVGSLGAFYKVSDPSSYFYGTMGQ
ncbi:MAG: putative zinc-binding metallopeptidase [Bacteroidota bacterium]